MPVFVFFLTCAFAQQPARVPDEKVLAKVNGQSITAGELRELLIGAPPEGVASVRAQPAEFLMDIFRYRRMRELAIEKEAHKRMPYEDQLAWKRLEVLWAAIMNEKGREFKIREEDAERRYEQNRHDYGTATVRLLFLAGDGPAVKAKAEGLLKQARAGANFAALVAKHSEDPDTAADGGLMSPVVPQSRMPKPIKAKIFEAKMGDAILVSYESAYYLFKVEALRLPAYEEVKQQILEVMLKEKIDAWVSELARTVEVKLVHEKFFQTLPMHAATQQGGGVDVPANAEIEEKTLLAVVNGENLTGQRFTGMMKAISPRVRMNAVQQPEAFLKQYGLMRRMAEAAETAGLHLEQPYKNQIRYNEEIILAQAAMDDHTLSISIGPDEQRKAYDDNPDRFRTADIRVIYVAFSLTPPPQTDPNAPKVLNEAEAKARIESILAKLGAGANFAEMAAVYSNDQDTARNGGQLPTIQFDDQKIPQPIRDVIFSTDEGEVGKPVRLANGFYLLRVDRKRTKSYEEVKDMLYEELRMARFNTWFDGLRNAFDATIEDPAAFQQVVAEVVSDPHRH